MKDDSYHPARGSAHAAHDDQAAAQASCAAQKRAGHSGAPQAPNPLLMKTMAKLASKQKSTFAAKMKAGAARNKTPGVV